MVRQQKQKHLFYGQRDLQSRVGRSVGQDFFFFSGGKNDPKNTKISTNKKKKKSDVFCRNFFEKFSDLFSKFVRFLSKKWPILRDFSKIEKKKKKKTPKWKKWVDRAHKTGFFFFA